MKNLSANYFAECDSIKNLIADLKSKKDSNLSSRINHWEEIYRELHIIAKKLKERENLNERERI